MNTSKHNEIRQSDADLENVIKVNSAESEMEEFDYDFDYDPNEMYYALAKERN